MIVKDIEIKNIIIPEVRVTAVYDEELTKLLKSTMQAAGMLSPINVVEVGDRFHLVDGLHRLQETIAEGKTTISAAVYAGEEKDALLLNLVTNHTRGKTKASELVQVMSALYKDYGMGLEGIAEKTGFPLDYVKKITRVATAVPRVLDLLDREIIGISAAYEISRLPNPRQQDEIAAKMPIYRMTVKELHDYIDQVLKYMEEAAANPAKPAPRQAPETRCEACESVVHQRHLKPVMLCPDCYGEVYRASRERRDAMQKVKESVDAIPGG